ncbi:MAG: uracil-DNA glycosylase [Treponema sp.]|nr:uracil-DNA glycosylase [Treponema sp.]
MELAEKYRIAEFLDTANDFLCSGYRTRRVEYNFEDDASLINNAESRAVSRSERHSGDSLENIAAEIKACKNCPLHEKRMNAVPGEGVIAPVVMVIGEGPGEDEDKQGRPFVGKAGQLLDKMLDSIGLSRDKNAFIANTVKCRPPLNREPRTEETEACSRFLIRQIELLKPKYILAAGRISAHALLKTSDPINKTRGSFTTFSSGEFTCQLLVTYHPAALLRSEDLKRPAWEDLKLLRSKLDTNAEPEN